MTRRRKILLLALGMPLLGLLALLLPLYSNFAEDVPLMRPFGWFDLPETIPYNEGEVAPAYLEAAAQARELLLSHVREIGVPAFSAAVAVDGQLVWSAAAGFASPESRREASPETLFRIGSASKAVTATLLARMADAGFIETDAPVSAYVRELPNRQWAALTARQLASHTAGIVGYGENRDLEGLYGSLRLQRSHENVAEGLMYFDGSNLLFSPGAGFHYSSYDYTLLSYLLQEAGGDTFQDLMHAQVLQPLGLDGPVPDGAHPQRASFYHVRPGQAQRWRDVNLSMKLAGGGFMATPADLAMLGAAWLDDDFISPETRRQFWTPQVLEDGTVNEQNYALGWRVSEATEKIPFRYIHHGGVSKGAMTWFAVIPEKRMAVAIIINTRVWPFSRWSGIFAELAEIFADPDITGL